ncbi:hypothetical protein TNCV_3313241 [Trichonephila clavipes]|nr:hypothetical protein TNCV_3313241 [Trichonephila clavipes]
MVFRVHAIVAVKIKMAHRSKEPRYRRSCLNQTQQLTPTTVEIRESHENVPHIVNPPTGQHVFFCPTREASKTNHTEFFVRLGTHQK